jgi:ubiquinone/menaquinone biosynthesis C-methylase UbiE
LKVGFIVKGLSMATDKIAIYNTRRTLFNTTAPRYDSLIMPAFGPLAERLVEVAAPQPNDRVLDLGTATGAVVLPSSQVASQVVGMDYAPAMLPLARQNTLKTQTKNVTFYQGDMHNLPHPLNTFSLALSSFSFNGIDPGRVLPEVFRILQPGGRLVFQEWGEVDEASKIVKQTIKAYRVEQAEGLLANFRLLGETPKPWDELGDAEDTAQFLGQVGFAEVKILRQQAAIPLEPSTFYLYRTAWTPYQAELTTMPADRRARVKAEIIDRLNTWAEDDGHFIWRPELLQMIAWKGR